MADVKVVSFVPQVITAVAKGSLNGMLKTAVQVTAQAKLFAPVADGTLRNSIGYKSTKVNNGKLSESVKANEVIVGTPVEHGVYQEFGTRKMSAQPYLRPAVDVVTNGTTDVKAMEKAMQDTVNKVTK